MDRILSLIEQYGYLVILFGVMAESTGVPIPGETILLAAGVLVQRGRLDLGDTIAFGILGAVVGDQIGYRGGREGGRRFVLRWGRYLFITPQRLARAEAFFARHGGKAVFLARFFSGLRVFGAVVAGISRMRWLTFLTYNAFGGVVWATAVVLVDYSPGQQPGARRAVAGASYTGARRGGRPGGGLLPGLPLGISQQGAARGMGGSASCLPPGGPLAQAQRRPAQVLHLTVGLLAAAGCLWLFGGLVEDLLTGDPIVRFDRALERLPALPRHGAPDHLLPHRHRLRLHGGRGAPRDLRGRVTRPEAAMDPAMDVDRRGGRKRHPQPASEGALPTPAAPLRVPLAG